MEDSAEAGEGGDDTVRRTIEILDEPTEIYQVGSNRDSKPKGQSEQRSQRGLFRFGFVAALRNLRRMMSCSREDQRAEPVTSELAFDPFEFERYGTPV